MVVSLLPDGRRWRLVFQFGYDVGREGSGDRITVPVGFVTDFASIPKFLFWLLPWWAKFNKSSVLHDCLYRIKKIGGRTITRKRADNVWLEAMLIDFRNHKSGELIARIEYRAVRLFGFPAW